MRLLSLLLRWAAIFTGASHFFNCFLLHCHGSPLLIELPATAPKCLPSGFRIAKWVDLVAPYVDGPRWTSGGHRYRHCNRLVSFRSPSLVYSAYTGMVSVKHRTCLYRQYHSLNFDIRLKCGRRKLQGGQRTLRLAHLGFQDDQRKMVEALTKLPKRRSLNVGSASVIRFDQGSYSVNISEEQTPGREVLTLAATHGDNLPLYYSMVAPKDARSASVLRLDRRTGQLFTNAALDRETMDIHVLKVTASERGNPLRSASVLVTVYVDDVQDHSPQFERTAYFETVSEDAQVGKTVLHVYASDKDAGANGEVTYSLTSQAPQTEPRHHFNVHPKTGVIQVAVPLDRERHGMYELLVTATDGSLTEPRNAQVLVKIDVKDVNDNYPQFSQSAYRASVLENADVPQRVAEIRATDADSDANGRLRYTVVSGAAHLFNVDYATGDVVLTQRLSAETSGGLLELVVRAQDSGSPALSNTTILEVAIIDINDHAPKFYSSQLPISVKESTPGGQQIARVQAFDADSGDNAIIQYSLNFPTDDYWPFEIDSVTGWMTITESLDRERLKKFEFEAVATDNGTVPLSSSIRVIVTVVDENDNSPVFESRLYNVSVAENANRGDEVVRVVAVDKDELSSVTYSLAIEGNEDNRFAILSQNDHGLITVNAALDSDGGGRRQYTLTVAATDDGGLRDTATVSVAVRDVNSAPVFLPHPYSAAVVESQPPNTTVAVIRARDADHGANAQVAYSLAGGKGYFSIDKTTGVIRIVKLLDRETETEFNLRITATDGGVPPLSAVSHLEVVVEDVNDDTPTFEQPEYQLSISEDFEVGNSIFTVTAVDRDAGQNRIIRYQFADTTANDTFKMDSSSGTIRLEQALDRETVSNFTFVVLAVDGGSPSLTGRAVVKIELTDINDNAPAFERAAYELFVSENAPAGSSVGRLLAVDPDVGANADVVYRIFDGDMRDFELLLEEEEEKETAGGSVDTKTRKGVIIRTRIALDYESKSQYRLQVQASSGVWSSVVEVTVSVLDENDHAPELNDFYLVIANYEDNEYAYSNRQLGRVPASDRDFNASLTFYMEHNRFLSLDPRSGLLSSTEYLDSNRLIDASLKFCVSDGPNMACAQCTLKYSHVTKRMLDNSVMVRIRGSSRDDLLHPTSFARLTDAIAAAGPFRKSDIRIFSVLESDESPTELYLNVTLAIAAHPSDRTEFYSAEKVRETLHLRRALISRVSGLQLVDFDDSFCGREPCMNHEVCRNTIKFGAAAEMLVTDNFMMRSVDPIGSFHCVCPEGFASRTGGQFQCDLEINLCYSNPCQHNGTCTQRENGYTCSCKMHRTGANCEYPTVSTDFCPPDYCAGGSQCRVDAPTLRPRCVECRHPPAFATDRCRLTARSFRGHGYVALKPVRQRYRLQITLSMATVEPDGLLFYNGRYDSAGDFLRLSLGGGRPLLEFSMGGHEQPLGGRRLAFADGDIGALNDGEWHSIRLTMLGKTMTLSVDDCDEFLALNTADEHHLRKCAKRIDWELPPRCSDPSVPCHRYLDVNGPLYVGGLPMDIKDGKEIDDSRPNRTPMSTALRSETIQSFDGCIKDMSIGGVPVDFYTDVIDSVNSTDGCVRKRDVCALDRPCADNTQDKCSNTFNGFWCECREYHGGPTCANDNIGPALHLESEQSLASWTVPESASASATQIAFYFRTTRSDGTTLLRARFDSDDALLFMIIKGKLAIEINTDLATVPLPDMSSGQWRHVSVTLYEHSINISVDYVYKKEFRVNSGIFHSTLLGLSSGGVDHPYIGCLKGVSVGSGRETPRYLSVEPNGDSVKTGCVNSHSCETDPCPPNSLCVQHWDTHRCRCLPGFVGPKCVDACSLNICRNGGICSHTGHAKGYVCACKEQGGYSGEHCEVPPTFDYGICPVGWWSPPQPTGGHCAPCRCRRAGFDQQCDRRTGQCICKLGTFLHKGRCVACRCFAYGSVGDACDPVTGQCDCLSKQQTVDSRSNRRCDQCPDRRQQIDHKTGQCEVVDAGFCPERYSSGVLWPRSAGGDRAVQSCPTGSVGLASRRCDTDGDWSRANTDNCTSRPFVPLANLLAQLDHGLTFAVSSGGSDATDMDANMDAAVIARRLANATTTVADTRLGGDEDSSLLFKLDLYTAYRLLLALLREELAEESIEQGGEYRKLATYIQDRRFIQDVISTSSHLLSSQNGPLWTELGTAQVPAPLRLINRLTDLGRAILNTKASNYLRPFQVVHENIVFAVDQINSKDVLQEKVVQIPTYANYVSRIAETSVPATKITINPASTVGERVFYSISRSNGLQQKEVISSIVTVYSSTPGEVQRRKRSPFFVSDAMMVTIEFALESPIRTGYPICSIWDSASESWSRDDCRINSFNSTAAVCSCQHFGTFAVLASENALVFHRHLDDLVWYVRPASLAVAMLLLLFAFLLRLCCRLGTTSPHQRQHGAAVRRAIHLAVLFSFGANFAALTALSFAENMIMCRVVSACLHWFSMCSFAWLFLYIFHVYRLSTELRVSNRESGWLFAVIGWLVPFVIAGCTALLDITAGASHSRHLCWFAPGDYRIWTLVAPVFLYLLLSFYVGITCFFMSMNKDWEMLLAKLRLKRTVGWYAAVVVCSCTCVSLCWLSTVVYTRWSQCLTAAVVLTTALLLCTWTVVVDRSQQAFASMSPKLQSSLPPLRNDCNKDDAARPESPFLAEDVAPRVEDEDEDEYDVGGGERGRNAEVRKRLLARYAPAVTPPTLSQQIEAETRANEADEDDSGHGLSDTDCRLSSALGQHQPYMFSPTTATGGGIAPVVGYVTPNNVKRVSPNQHLKQQQLKEESFYKSFTKPDLIPTWGDGGDQQLKSSVSSVAASSPTSSTATSSVTVGGPLYHLPTAANTTATSHNHAYQQRRPYQPRQQGASSLQQYQQQQQQMQQGQQATILSPVQKVLFGGKEEHVPADVSVDSSPSPSYQRFHTFATPSRAIYSSINRSNNQYGGGGGFATSPVSSQQHSLTMTRAPPSSTAARPTVRVVDPPTVTAHAYHSTNNAATAAYQQQQPAQKYGNESCL